MEKEIVTIYETNDPDIKHAFMKVLRDCDKACVFTGEPSFVSTDSVITMTSEYPDDYLIAHQLKEAFEAGFRLAIEIV